MGEKSPLLHKQSHGKDGQWFIIFRLYGPDKPFFDKSWKLPDIGQAN